MVKSTALHGTIAASTLLLSAASAASAQELNLYTSREPGLIEPLLEAFTESTGVTVNTVFLKDGLAERVEAEGEASPADVLMAVDVGKLADFVEKGLTQPVESEVLTESIPENLRGPENNWFALSTRARVVYAAKDLDLDAITYEELADPKWEGKLCIRSGQHPYNTGLISAFIAHHGAEATEEWLNGMKANLARKAGGGDRDGAKDILGGICDIAVANSYYVGRMRSAPAEKSSVGDAIKVILPTFQDGAQVNISAAVAKYAANKDEAVQLLEYLVSDEAQKTMPRRTTPRRAAGDPMVESLAS